MLRSRFVALIAAFALVAAIGGAAAFAGEKAGAVDVTTDCNVLNQNTISFVSSLFVYLHSPNAEGWTYTITYQKTKDTFTDVLGAPITSCFDGWFLYPDGTASEFGAATLQVWNGDGKSVGSDGFNVK